MQNEDPFAAFKPSETPIEKIPIEKKKHWKTAKAERDANKVRDKLAKQRKRAVHRGPMTSKWLSVDNGSVLVPLSTLTMIRHLTDDEVRFTIAMANGIAELEKPAQRHVVAALTKIFS